MCSSVGILFSQFICPSRLLYIVCIEGGQLAFSFVYRSNGISSNSLMAYGPFWKSCVQPCSPPPPLPACLQPTLPACSSPPSLLPACPLFLCLPGPPPPARLASLPRPAPLLRPASLSPLVILSYFLGTHRQDADFVFVLHSVRTSASSPPKHLFSAAKTVSCRST